VKRQGSTKMSERAWPLVAFLAMVTGIVVPCSPNTHADENDAFNGPMQFTMAGNGGNCSGCEWIDATGKIDARTPQRLQDYLDAEKAKWGGIDHIIVFNSPGGDLAAGIRLGRLLRHYNMITDVGTTYNSPGSRFEAIRDAICASACAYAYLGGADRNLGKGSQLGFHQFRYENETSLGISPALSDATGMSEAQLVMGVLAAYLVEMGVDARVLTLASTAPSDQIYFPGADELTKYRILTPSGFGQWEMRAINAGLVAYSEHQESNSPELSVSLFCVAQTNTPNVMIDMENAGDKRLTEQDFLDAIQGITLDIDDQRIVLAKSPAQVQRILKVSSDERSYYLNVLLGANDVGRLENANSIDIWLSFYHAFYNFGPRVVVTANGIARKEISLAFRNCI
jgi:hypothetical protein